MNAGCRFLEWDSAFFGWRIARYERNCLSLRDLAVIDAWCAEARIDCLYFLADAGSHESIIAAERAGFGLKDLRVTYEWRASVRARGVDPRVGDTVRVRAYAASDLPELVRIARTAHTDTRFFFDTRFDPARAASLYETWIEQACAGEADVVFVGEQGGRPAGYLSCHLEAPLTGRIGLAAVDRGQHGQGIGRAMIDHALRWFRERHVQEIDVITQGRNVAAHRFYQSAGFLTKTVECWYHKWFT
jgi:ribosomal protein S18 acetylase RimI-like enzyme